MTEASAGESARNAGSSVRGRCSPTEPFRCTAPNQISAHALAQVQFCPLHTFHRAGTLGGTPFGAQVVIKYFLKSRPIFIASSTLPPGELRRKLLRKGWCAL